MDGFLNGTVVGCAERESFVRAYRSSWSPGSHLSSAASTTLGERTRSVVARAAYGAKGRTLAPVATPRATPRLTLAGEGVRRQLPYGSSVVMAISEAFRSSGFPCVGSA